jgi:signal transduction histidine kinase
MTDLITGDAALGTPPSPGDRTGAAGADANSETWMEAEPGRVEGESGDRLEPFGPAILAVRWATTGVSVALASPALLAVDLPMTAWVAAALANTTTRTFVPLRYTGSTTSMVVLFGEIGLHVLAVVATGYWHSPLVLLMINAIIIAGFARGFGFAIRVGLTSALAVTVPELSAQGWDGEEVAQSAQWATLLLLGGIVAGYSRRLSGEATRRHSLALDRVARLADANALLTNLHRVAQTLPASLDQAEVLDSSLSRLRGLVAHDAAIILIRDEPAGTWSVARQKALGLSGTLDQSRIPIPAARAIAQSRLVRVGEFRAVERGFGPNSRSGLYVPLLARGRLIGLLGVESRSTMAFSQRDEEILRGFVEPVALAIDNARLFDRIRTVGADEERTRIARDLHDRIGQSLAYLGFEIDRMARQAGADSPIATNLGALRDDLRTVIGEVRDTLYDLRTDVTDNKDLAKTVHEFATRVSERSNLTISLDCDTGRRLPILQEREMWRIAQEALVNVERHARATEVAVLWRCDRQGALLEVADNGRGLPAGHRTGGDQTDSYGIVGMHERASSIGATLELTSRPGEGTKVRCFLAQN